MNSYLGNNKPNFIADEPMWHEKPIAEMFKAYIEEYLSANEEEKTVIRSTGGAKLKQLLATGGKEQPLLPENCLIHHGDNAMFLTYQKQLQTSATFIH
jgi:hypothetical protein